MQNLKSFSEFSPLHIYESLSSLEMEKWPSNWKEMPIWKELEDLGFEESTTPIQARNGTIMIRTTNPGISRIYPEGIVLQQSGYIRDKGVTSGFIKKYQGEFKLYDIFKYLSDRFRKELEKSLSNDDSGPLTDEQIREINLGTKSKWIWNKETQAVDMNGMFSQSKNSDRDVLATINFGNIKGNFVINRLNSINSLEFLPENVGGNMRLESLGGITNLKTFPTVNIGGNLDIPYYKLDSLAGFKYIDRSIGGFSCRYFTAIPFNTETAVKLLNAEEKIRIPAYTQSPYVYVSDQEKTRKLVLSSGMIDDDHFKKNPMDLQYLNDDPELKAEILKRTGLKDFSDLGFILRNI